MIPTEIGELVALTYLDLGTETTSRDSGSPPSNDNNWFPEATIPTEFGRLQNLEYLDLGEYAIL